MLIDFEKQFLRQFLRQIERQLLRQFLRQMLRQMLRQLLHVHLRKKCPTEKKADGKKAKKNAQKAQMHKRTNAQKAQMHKKHKKHKKRKGTNSQKHKSAHLATSPSCSGSSPRSMMENIKLYGMSASLGMEGQNLAMTSARPNLARPPYDFFIMYQPQSCAKPTLEKNSCGSSPAAAVLYMLDAKPISQVGTLPKKKNMSMRGPP